MLSRKTKKSKRNGAVAPLLIGLLGISTFALWHSVSTPSFAAETEDPVGVVVTGVANVTEYLTSLVLYSTDPQSKTAVVLKYDADLNGLVVEGAVNADALSVGSGNIINGTGSAILGGEKNEIKSENANYYVILGGKKNLVTINAKLTGNVIVGGSGAKFDGSLGTNSYSLIIGGDNAGYAGSFQVYLGGSGSRNSFSDNYTLSLGTGGNIVSAGSVLMGEKIKGGVAGNNLSKYTNIFVWSDTDSFSPNVSGAFYVNAQSGFGLNTNNPRMTFDMKNAGVLVIEKNTSLSSATLVDCKEDSKGTIVYISRTSGTTNVAGICGCNGSGWVPFSIDPNIQSVCNKNASTLKCLGTVTNVDKGSVNGVMRWYSDANDGNGDWFYPYWTYGGVENVDGGDRECSYTCKCNKTGKCYHPNVENPIGWFTGSCVECTNIENKEEWVLSGNGIDNCAFNCKGGYKYNEYDRTCTTCLVGERTPAKNQSGSCERCEMPVGKALTSNGRVDDTLTSNLGILKDGTPYFGDFTTVGKGGDKYSCDFTCAPGFYINDTNNSNNACIRCMTGKYSDGKSNTCSSCTNGPGSISFKWRNYIDDSVSWNQGSLGSSSSFSYTSNGSDGPTSCEWECKSSLGLVREGDACVCEDKANTHLEMVGSVAKCVPNVKDFPCGTRDANPDSTTIKGISIAEHRGGVGTWTGWQWAGVDWTYVPYEDYELNGKKLFLCEWTCPEYYRRSGSSCLPPAVGECSSLDGTYVSKTANLSNYSSSSLCNSNSTLGSTPVYRLSYQTFNPFNGQFVGNSSFIEAEGHWKWSCNGELGASSADCYAYVKGQKESGKCDLTKGTEACVMKAIVGSTTYIHYPVLTGYSQYGDGRTWTQGSTGTWLKWQCPGFYGGDFVHCGFCDANYTFSTGDQRCYSNTRISNCENGEKPNSWTVAYIHGTGSYTQYLYTGQLPYKYRVDSTKDTLKWEYTSSAVVADGNGTSTCKFTCAPGYHESSKACVANTYTLKLQYKDGKTPDNNMQAYYDKSFTINNPARAGYIFTGWNISSMESGVTHYVGSSTNTGTQTSASNIIGTYFMNLRRTHESGPVNFVAQWTPIKYTIRFNKNGGSGDMADLPMTYDVTGTLTSLGFTKDGASFKGWAIYANGSVKYSDGQQVSNLTTTNNGIVNLYAKWEGCPVKTYSDGTSCKDCPDGFTSAVSTTSINGCYIDVPAGSYKKEKTKTTTVGCGAGKYSTAHKSYYGADDSDSCKNISAGCYGTSASSSCPNQCKKSTETQVGSYSSEGASACTDAANGYYTDQAKATTSKKCISGYYCPDGMKKSCPTGFGYSDEGASVITQCYIKVSAGKYKKENTSTTTVGCGAGKYSTAHNGYYNVNDSSSCMNISAGCYGTSASSSCPNECKKSTTTKAGNYSSEGASACTDATNGYYTDKDKATTSKKCPKDYYCPSGKIKNCPDGYESPEGSDDISDCYLSVPGGKYKSRSDSSTVADCAADTYSLAHYSNYGVEDSCLACGEGTSSAAGSTSCTTDDTQNTSTCTASTPKNLSVSSCNLSFGFDSGSEPTEGAIALLYYDGSTWKNYNTSSSSVRSFSLNNSTFNSMSGNTKFKVRHMCSDTSIYKDSSEKTVSLPCGGSSSSSTSSCVLVTPGSLVQDGCKLSFSPNEFDPTTGSFSLLVYDGGEWSVKRNGTKSTREFTLESGRTSKKVKVRYNCPSGTSTSNGSTYKDSSEKQLTSSSCSSNGGTSTKVDWNGNPLEWQAKHVYGEGPGGIWSAEIGKYTNCINGIEDTNWDGTLAVGQCIHSPMSIYGGYVPCGVNSTKKWCYFENDNPSGLVTKVTNYMAELYK